MTDRHSLNKSNDARLRSAAALAAASISWPPGGLAAIAMPSGPNTSPSSPAPISVASFRSQFAILEQAVCDTSMSFELRDQALKELISVPMLVPLHRCGLELARQLELPDTGRRVAAARLLHMIDPDTLAGINVPEESLREIGEWCAGFNARTAATTAGSYPTNRLSCRCACGVAIGLTFSDRNRLPLYVKLGRSTMTSFSGCRNRPRRRRLRANLWRNAASVVSRG
jgi:hypothetical protein